MGTDTQGKLYLCPTPIGNLGDITARTLEVLRTADLIAAEDTRNTLRLLNHFDLHVPLTSYHEHNKFEKASELVDNMLKGKVIACVTDAGTPGISDPGEILVRKAVEAGIEVTSLPGATAFVTALTVSGFSTERFVFEGFLPREKKARREILDFISKEMRTIILYEAPHHLKGTLSELREVLGGSRRIALCRELTKLHEEILRLSMQDACDHYKDRDPRGEYVLVIEGMSREEIAAAKQREFKDMSISEHVALYEGQGFDRKEAMKRTAADRGMAKRDVYNALLL